MRSRGRDRRYSHRSRTSQLRYRAMAQRAARWCSSVAAGQLAAFGHFERVNLPATCMGMLASTSQAPSARSPSLSTADPRVRLRAFRRITCCLAARGLPPRRWGYSPRLSADKRAADLNPARFPDARCPAALTRIGCADQASFKLAAAGSLSLRIDSLGRPRPVMVGAGSLGHRADRDGLPAGPGPPRLCGLTAHSRRAGPASASR
jgi:hypothetical protein